MLNMCTMQTRTNLMTSQVFPFSVGSPTCAHRKDTGPSVFRSSEGLDTGSTMLRQSVSVFREFSNVRTSEGYRTSVFHSSEGLDTGSTMLRGRRGRGELPSRESVRLSLCERQIMPKMSLLLCVVSIKKFSYFNLLRVFS